MKQIELPFSTPKKKKSIISDELIYFTSQTGKKRAIRKSGVDILLEPNRGGGCVIIAKNGYKFFAKEDFSLFQK